MEDSAEHASLTELLQTLTTEHRDLDLAISELQKDAVKDELLVRRLKKRKLLLKDKIAWIHRQIDPDVPA
jgi:hypothetical protein